MCEKDRLEIERLSKQLVCFQWQPISTAPRDGTRILAFGGGLGEYAEVVSFNSRVGCWNTSTDTLDDVDEEPDGYIRPRLWMPLPASPLTDEQRGEQK